MTDKDCKFAKKNMSFILYYIIILYLYNIVYFWCPSCRKLLTGFFKYIPKMSNCRKKALNLHVNMRGGNYYIYCIFLAPQLAYKKFFTRFFCLFLEYGPKPPNYVKNAANVQEKTLIFKYISKIWHCK